MTPKLIDTHTHIYAQEFCADLDAVLTRASQNGVEYLLLPNIDAASVLPMLEICNRSPQYLPMIGLHPTSVKENFAEELSKIESFLPNHPFCAIGEVGIDLYWDKTFQKEQEEALIHQMHWAEQYDLPLVIHMRNSFSEVTAVLKQNKFDGMRGVFHCFSGNLEEAQEVLEIGFSLGIGGVVTFKNSTLPAVVKEIPLSRMLLETDSPYLAPSPHRGKRNESSYLPMIAQKIAEIKQCTVEQVAEETTQAAKKLFNIQEK